MARRKSPLLITMGVLCIVAGSLGLTCGGCGIVGGAFTLSFSGGPGSPLSSMVNFLDSRAPFWRVIEVGKPIVHFFVSSALVATGIALVCRKAWGRWSAIVCAVISIPLHVGYIAYYLAVLAPAQDAYIQSVAFGTGAAAAPMGPTQGQEVLATINAVFWCLVALGLLIGMLVPAAGEAFAPERRRRLPRDFDDRNYRVFDDDDRYDDE